MTGEPAGSGPAKEGLGGTEAVTVDAKYVFVDVVGFTRDRSVEAQSDIVEYLNETVLHVLSRNKVPEDKRFLLPTGDGLCVALLPYEGAPYDVHVRAALGIIGEVHEHNEDTEDGMRRFEVRIGINANTDNLIIDINGALNLAGAGINVARRVMDFGDGGQVLVSHAVHETLRYREKYMDSFMNYTARTKHGELVPVHQLVAEGVLGLNLDVPGAFRKPERPERQDPKLPKYVAYYLAHAIANHPVLLENRGSIYHDDAVIALLHLLAYDSEEKSKLSQLDSPYPQTYKAGTAEFWEQYQHYEDQDEQVVRHLARAVQFGLDENLMRYGDCFAEEGSIGMKDFRAASDHGRRKLKEDWPEIWEEFGLDEHTLS